MIAKLQLHRQVSDGILQGLVNRGGQPVQVVLTGPDDKIRRIVDLDLVPFLFDDSQGSGIRWWAKSEIPFNGPGGFYELFADVSVIVTDADSIAAIADEIEPRGDRDEGGGR